MRFEPVLKSGFYHRHSSGRTPIRLYELDHVPNVFTCHAERISSLICTEEGTRTPMTLLPHGPEPCVSTNSTTSAGKFKIINSKLKSLSRTCSGIVTESKFKTKSFNLYDKIKKTTSQYHLFYLQVLFALHVCEVHILEACIY